MDCILPDDLVARFNDIAAAKEALNMMQDQRLIVAAVLPQSKLLPVKQGDFSG